MSTVILDKEHSAKVQCGDNLFHLYQGDDGTLCIEAPGRCGLEVSISDDDDEQVTARGLWVNIDITSVEEGGD
jgi:hypothetical protein